MTVSFLLYTLYFFYFLSYLIIALAKTSSMMLKNSVKREHSCLVPDLSVKGSSFSSLSMMLAIGVFFKY